MTDVILIAVADLIFRAKISETARQVGRTAISAATPEAIAERASASRPALVIVDLGDERVDPFATIRRIKADPALGATRVLGFFSHVRTDQREAALEAGCDVVLPRSRFVARLASLLETLGA